MIKIKNFHFIATQEHETLQKNTTEYEQSIEKFLNEIIEENHTLISINEVSYGQNGQTTNNRLKTTITYKENQTRKVLVEKK